MYAVDSLGDAIDATRSFMTPIRVRRWLKLAVIALFVAGVGLGAPTAPTGDTADTGDADVEIQQQDGEVVLVDAATGEEFPIGLTIEELLLLAAAVVVIALLLWLAFAIVGAILEFVFVESLRTDEVRVRRNGRHHLGRALGLFAFRLALGLLAAAVVLVPAYLWLSPVDGAADVELSTVATLSALAFLAYLPYAVVMRLTTEFVVPVMVLEERGVLDGWRRYWPTLRAEPAEYAVYLVLATVVWIAGSIAVTVVWFIGAIALFIPFLLLMVGSLFLGPLAIPLVVLFAILLAIAAALLWGALVTPLLAYVRYYALLILGDTNPALDLIPDRREAIRADGGSGAPPAVGDGPSDSRGTSGRDVDVDAGSNEGDRESRDDSAERSDERDDEAGPR